MSLVGTRPILQDELLKYELPWYFIATYQGRTCYRRY